MKRIIKLILLLLLCPYVVKAQLTQTDTITDSTATKHSRYNFRQLVIPVALVGYGVIGLDNGQCKKINYSIRNEVVEDIDQKITIDDFMQYAPALSVYVLNLTGVEGKHNFKDRTIIMATSYLVMSSTVLSLKSVTHQLRPDGSSYNSFPSGHTATAFAGAEFLWQEYKDVSIWYGISGYLVATGTGMFRMYNNRHWLTDVAAGAGIGILSTKFAYWVYPFLRDKVFKGKKGEKKVSAMAMPYYNGEQMGAAVTIKF
ncbi:phosphatase PAP2 family protein [Flavobacterium sp. ST-75]|uniref:Phosphatase PAP2 family protein n=1 Tax=Flavobacterium rhizophilum TaxID=3163296 RepID=A0ABW8YHS8_9FLAO